MILHTVNQRTPEWARLRAGIVTASELDALVTPEFKARSGEGVTTYMNRKLVERILGRPYMTFSGSGDTEQGNLKETDAYPWFALTYNVPLRNDVFCTTDDGKVGCSPDGLWSLIAPGMKLQDGLEWQDGLFAGVEIKCPAAHTHVGYLRAGVLPKDYRAQVHGSMFVTGAPFWYFLSYHQQFPEFVLKVERDEKIQAAIKEATDAFNQEFDAQFERLVERCGLVKTSSSTLTAASVSDGKPSVERANSNASAGLGMIGAMNSTSSPKASDKEPVDLWRFEP